MIVNSVRIYVTSIYYDIFSVDHVASEMNVLVAIAMPQSTFYLFISI